MFSFIACNKSDYSKYQQLIKDEPLTGKRYDSIFKGIYFGMPSKDFYAHCWSLNKQGLFTDGENNTAVLYHMEKGTLPQQASMNFYPLFIDNKIAKLQAIISYDAWAPWNKKLDADSLQLDVLHMMQRWYPQGNAFLSITDKDRGTLFIKVDGNRRIIIGKYDDVRVKVDYTDLLVKQNK